MRSGCGLPALNSLVRVSAPSPRFAGSFALAIPACTRATVDCLTVGNGGVSENASGPEPAAMTNAPRPAAANAARRRGGDAGAGGAGPGRRRGSRFLGRGGGEQVRADRAE